MSADGNQEPTPTPTSPLTEEVLHTDAHNRYYARASKPQPHRCNPYLEDFLHSIFQSFPPHMVAPGKAFLQCMLAEPGAEPPRVGNAEAERPRSGAGGQNA
ncbi:uncharacterized protein AMSG_03071 [Thecamonas trahens ATCC 50062]|uniref:Uncharacterized protein n=1 Tax=Thecamonas trahens ATCC 50062 TaxID=461836 RepID=A0A0L0D2W1_THETB|nr:hypothetical protein AMSG_03071 [Thecamonas trahens ATCC 50062]KNC46634.1 hypothetical protein AMSG_03071 [Thecamonas trahens ATCC 50062]|eukprot:XP_013760407.1 hypothetical protein AMSG_03071 [Thecamonas trahens ATCC 50062]